MSLCSDRRARFAALILAAVMAAAPLLLVAPAAAAATGRLGLTFVDQSQWVVPPASGGAATFALSLRATNAPAGTTVTLALYTRLRTRSALQQDLSSGPTGYELTRTSETLARLPADPHAPGSLELAIAVTTSLQATSAPSSPSLNLGCAPPTGSGTCPGVYPVVVSLHGGGATARFTTFLTYATSDTHPLDFAWVAPLSAPVNVRPHASTPGRAVAPLSSTDAAALEGLVAELHANPTVPVTITPSPETLQALAGAGAAGRAAVAALAGLSTDQAVDEVSAAPYVPIDLAALGAGDGAEVSNQMGAGAATLQQLHVATSAPTALTASDSLDSALATGMTEAHVGLLLVPSAVLAPLPRNTPQNNGTWAAPFDLQLTKGTRGTHRGTGPTVTAAAADGTLQRDFSGSRNDPALAATQFLADLSMVHFEQPYAKVSRGVVAVPPAGWVPNATFDRVLLAGLTGNPDVTAVTLAKYLATVPNGGTRSVSSSASSTKGTGLGPNGVKTLASERRTLTAFDSAVAGTPPLALTQLDQLLLDTEDSQWRGTTRSAATATFHRVLEDQLHLVKFPTVTVTLTAPTGWIPVTVLSSAPYTVHGILSVNGNEKFVFPDSSSHVMWLNHPTNAWRVDVRARSSGDLALTATFTTPHGTLVIASSTLTVRSTGTSLVGIVLTAVALAVLLVWWARTWWSRRRSRPHKTRILQS